MSERTIFRATALYSGDGWKDGTRKGDVAFVYGQELPPPYAPRQYPRVGNIIHSVLDDGGWLMDRATLWEVMRLLPTIWRERRELGAALNRGVRASAPSSKRQGGEV
jgi:hypothetical protein